MKNYLLDTHIILWYLLASDELSDHAKQCIGSGRCYYSLASLWEVAIKQTLKKLECEESIPELAERCRRAGFTRLAVTPEHLETIKTLPLIHRDPFDRLLTAQALHEDLTIITHDRFIKQYPVRTEF